jgi:hypothetical protein
MNDTFKTCLKPPVFSALNKKMESGKRSFKKMLKRRRDRDSVDHQAAHRVSKNDPYELIFHTR